MRALVQRVSSAKVSVKDTSESMAAGLLVFVGFKTDDGTFQRDWMIEKILHLRIFATEGPEKSVTDIGGEILVVSQFTLYADVSKGRRPSYQNAAKADQAQLMYRNFLEAMRAQSSLTIREGFFQQQMQVELVNEGPQTYWLESP